MRGNVPVRHTVRQAVCACTDTDKSVPPGRATDMVKSGRANPKPAPQYRRHFIQEWLDYKNKTHENLADGIEKSRSYVTKIVNGTRPYTQEFLEATAEYLAIDVASLLMRNPQKTDAI